MINAKEARARSAQYEVKGMFAFRPVNLIYKFLSEPYSFCLNTTGLSNNFIAFFFFPTLFGCLLGTKAQLVDEGKKSYFLTPKCVGFCCCFFLLVFFLITQYCKFDVSSTYSEDH